MVSRHVNCHESPCAPRNLHSLAALFAFDYFLNNFNRMHGGQTTNTFIRLRGSAPRSITRSDWSLVFIDNEFCAHCQLYSHYFPPGRHVSFAQFVGHTCCGPEHQLRLGRDAALGSCPVAPALLADLERHASGAAFASATVRAMQPARAQCVQRLWRRIFSQTATDLPAFLTERFDGLVRGLREWGCVIRSSSRGH